jgi:hypothetical protein
MGVKYHEMCVDGQEICVMALSEAEENDGRMDLQQAFHPSHEVQHGAYPPL